MPPRDPKPANSRRKSKLKLDMPEPELAGMLEQYCDLRQRGFTQAAIQTRANWTRHHQNLLLEEAQRREMPSSQKSQQQAVTEWLLAMYDAGTELRVIQRASAYTGQQTKSKLQAALDAASGPTPTGLIIRGLDGEPARGLLVRPKRTPDAPAVRWRLPGRLPRRTRHTAVHRGSPQANWTTIQNRP